MAIIEIKVITNAKRDEIREKDGRILVYLNEEPVRGKANKRLLKFIKKKTGYEIKILKGEYSNIKLIEIPLEKEKFLRII